MKIFTKLAYQYIGIFLNFSTTLNHLHPLQVENCDSNSRLVVDEDDNGNFRLERVKLSQLGNKGCCLFQPRQVIFSPSLAFYRVLSFLSLIC